MRALVSAVSVFVTPGPAVTTATPTPVSRAVASAAKAAVCSCRVSMTRMPRRFASTKIGAMCPPASPNSDRTPCRYSTSATKWPPLGRDGSLALMRYWAAARQVTAVDAFHAASRAVSTTTSAFSAAIEYGRFTTGLVPSTSL